MFNLKVKLSSHLTANYNPGREVFTNVKTLLKHILGLDDHLSGATTFDIWTDKFAKKSYIGITYHYIDKEFQLKKVLLAANVFPHPHNFETIGSKFIYHES